MARTHTGRPLMMVSTVHGTRMELMRVAGPVVGSGTALLHLLLLLMVLLRKIRVGVVHERGTRVNRHVGSVRSLSRWRRWTRWRWTVGTESVVVRRRLMSAIPSTLLPLSFLLIHLIDHTGQRVQRVGRNVDHGAGVGSAREWTAVRGRSRQGRLRAIPIARPLSRIVVRVGS